QAKKYILNNGRKLEQERFRFHFESGSSNNVIQELGKFQNDDGGFGKGLESDLRSVNSSVVATCHALSICREIGVKKQTLIDMALKYFLSCYDSDKKVFPIITSNVLDVPHPWWWTEKDLEKNFDGFRINPTTEVLSHLIYFGSRVPEGLEEETLSRINSLETVGIYDLRCIKYLIKVDELLVQTKNAIVEKLAPLILFNISREKWDGDGMHPLNIVKSPDDIFAKTVSDELIQSNLEYDIQNQKEDGSWALNWSWADIDEQLWSEAEKEWKAVKTLEKLLVFKAFNYL
ncbi:MAG: hypothetical protein ACW99R_16280, partial [Candidatus Hodarchaeales archaeon]